MVATELSERRWAGPVPPIGSTRLLLGALASLATLTLLVLLLDTGRLWADLAAVPDKPVTLASIAVAYTAAFALRAVAWRLLFSTPTSTARLFSILQTSLFLNHLLPLKAGEVARPYLVYQNGVPAAEAGSTTLVARLMDFLALAAIALLALPAVGRSTEIGLAFGVSVALILFACALLLVLRARPLPFLPEAAQPLANKLQTALREIRGERIALAFPLVVASWLLESAVLLGAARFLGIELAFEVAAGATAFTIVFQAVHFTPGGLGVYETSMTSVLALQGVPAEEALALAVVTHGLKFAYSFTVGLAFAGGEAFALLKGKTAGGPKKASRVEIVVARAWNVVNEGKPFTPVFALTCLIVLSLPHALDAGYWARFGAATLLVAPLALLFWRFDFPLKLRAALWVDLALFLLAFRFFDATTVLVVVVFYFIFTVVVWGTVYYHLRIGTPWTNFTRFWRLVLENPDPTSGNLQEQLPKLLILTLAVQYLIRDLTWQNALAVEAFALFVGATALLVHQWFFTWVPALPQPRNPHPSPLPGRERGSEESRRSSSTENGSEASPARLSRKVIAIVIDGCRADRLREANTPFIDSLRAEGTEYTNVSTVYPARTVTCFSSMLTGAAPKTHGMRSNFVPSLGVKCDSVFESLRRAGMAGKLVGIAHLIDAFGHKDVQSVTAVMHNDEIDDALVERAKRVMEADDPDLLVLQLLSVDQTGHARGSYFDEYLRKIEATDRLIEAFLRWCRERGHLKDATVLITADHGQGIGIGGHGHMSPPEIHVPCIFWGAGVPAGCTSDAPRFVTDIAPTLCHLLGVPAPRDSIGLPLLVDDADPSRQPLVYIIPAYNEAANLPAILQAIHRTAVAPDAQVVVVDDGSTDGTAAVAAAHGAIVVRHDVNHGLGAALRSGFAKARELNARAAVYLDADGEYDPAEAARLLQPIESGEADFVLGSRFMGRIEGMTRPRRVANRAFSLLLSGLCGRYISDGQTGFRAFSRRALDVAEIVHDYNYAQVLTLDLLHKGMRLREMPVSYRRRTTGRSFVSAEYLWRVPVGMLREVLSD